MSKSTLNDKRHPAVICRERGWVAGTKLVGKRGHDSCYMEITAIGRMEILAIADGDEDEIQYPLSYRDWNEVKQDAVK